MLRSVVTSILLSAVLCAAQTTYKNCSTNATPVSVTDVNVTGCTSPPCVLTRGKNASMTMDVTFNKDEATVYIKIEVNIEGHWIGVPIPNDDGCKLGLHCPEHAKDTEKITVTLPIPKLAPKIETIIRWTLWLDKDETSTQLDCIELEVKLI